MQLKNLENVFVLLFSGNDRTEFAAGIQLFLLQNNGNIEIEDIQYSHNGTEYSALIIYRALVDIENIYYPPGETTTVEGEEE